VPPTQRGHYLSVGLALAAWCVQMATIAWFAVALPLMLVGLVGTVLPLLRGRGSPRGRPQPAAATVRSASGR
jgi:hypothetical protein